jgi:L-rhamnose mutarotase
VPASRGGEAGAAAEDCACNWHYLNFQISAYGSTMTERYAFKMFLNPGCAAEYRRRHDAIWPELVCLLTEAGVANYSIHLDQETSILFAYLERGEDHRMEALPDHPVMRRWWDHMTDIMRTHPDGSPVAIPLTEMFHLP